MMIDKGNGEFHFYGSEEPSNGPKSPLDGIRTSYHYNKTSEEWVVMIHFGCSTKCVCGCDSELHAKLVASSIGAVLATADCTFCIKTGGSSKVEEVDVPNLVEFDAMTHSLHAAADAILDFIA